ncbi:hypothetical protein CQ018_05335 [Arthrobacter sp. MYb227]|uniref:ABC transporter substrate-binding protein n=1 Tax=Arthrobacter sp. MYb227 TaxID=1848601 RepID=UPI000CFBBE18|nr:ABC transporter substrate-binding protein [Arthrobacter sp. MYb227]PQZ94770.1 hypothetical protein CQ018_05335 [Arthrobacter sp. MYb227]
MNKAGIFGSNKSGLLLPASGVSRRSLLKFAGLGAAALGSASLLTACGGGSSAPAGAKELTKFVISSVPGDSFILDAINVANKDYANHGLDVPKHINPSSGVQGFQLLTAGAVDGMGSDTLNLMANHANNQGGKRPVLIGFRTKETTYGIVRSKAGTWPAADASFEEKMRSLKGKKVGVTAVGAGGDLQLRLALEEAGMKYEDVTVLAVGLTAQAIPNMNAERIDAYVGVQWTAARFVAQETGGAMLVDFAEPSVPSIVRDQAVVAITVREETAQQQPELVQQWVAAQNDASEFMLKDKAGAAKILNDTGLGGQGAEIAAAYLEHYAAQVQPKLNPMFKADRETVERMAAVGERFGSIGKGAIKYETFVPEFARA